HLLDFGRKLRVLGAVASEKSRPFLPSFRTSRTDAGGEMFVDAVGHEELRILGPTIAALGEPNLFVSQWLAMSRRRVLLVRGPAAPVTVQPNEGSPLLGLTADIH